LKKGEKEMRGNEEKRWAQPAIPDAFNQTDELMSEGAQPARRGVGTCPPKKNPQKNRNERTHLVRGQSAKPE